MHVPVDLFEFHRLFGLESGLESATHFTPSADVKSKPIMSGLPIASLHD